MIDAPIVSRIHTHVCVLGETIGLKLAYATLLMRFLAIIFLLAPFFSSALTPLLMSAEKADTPGFSSPSAGLY